MNPPNIFSYATSELSQDAFICWFLSWANPQLKSSDSSLHICATKLIELFFTKHNCCTPEKFTSVEVRKQDKNIDVLCIINSKYPIIIEDKTNTGAHSGQLEKYLNDVIGRGYKRENVLPIYYKTEEQSCYKSVRSNSYQPVLRNEILEVINEYKGANSILLDYRKYLQSLSDDVASFLLTDINNWSWRAWTGFYSEVQKELGGDWDYVPNPRGGFYGHWWYWHGDDECKQYLQLEENKLCFKVWVKDPKRRSELRSKWYKRIITESQKFEFDVKKPPRFGNGAYMTVCVLENYRKELNGSLDMKGTINFLKDAQSLLNLALEPNNIKDLS